MVLFRLLQVLSIAHLILVYYPINGFTLSREKKLDIQSFKNMKRRQRDHVQFKSNRFHQCSAIMLSKNNNDMKEDLGRKSKSHIKDYLYRMQKDDADDVHAGRNFSQMSNEKSSCIVTREEFFAGNADNAAMLMAFSALTSHPSNAAASTSATEIVSEENKRGKGESLLFRLPKENVGNTYDSLIYIPKKFQTTALSESVPVLFVLHGAARKTTSSEQTVWELADIKGQHSGLPPSLLYEGTAPKELSENFIVVAPFKESSPNDGKDTNTFYDEPRAKILDFMQNIQTYLDQADENSIDNKPHSQPSNNIPHASIPLNKQKAFLLGFSDGATVAIELMTSKRIHFNAGIICSYGFTGPSLPQAALERLTFDKKGFWIFHCKEDGIFPVKCSDNLYRQLKGMYASDTNEEEQQKKTDELVRYSRFESDPEGFSGKARGHTTGITASKMPEVYNWMLSFVY